jgi:hypothetical protein
MVIIYSRIYDIYIQLTKTLRDSLISHKIVLELSSNNATISAYNGMKYTIESIVKNLGNVKICDYTDDGNKKIFCILRERTAYNTNINIYIHENEEKNQILFDVHIYMM